MMMVKFHLILLLALLLINESMGAPIHDTTKVQSKEDEKMKMQATAGNNQAINVSQCHDLMTYEEIRDILAHSPCVSAMKCVNYSTPLRTKCGDETALANDLYALQSILNDHRKMIHYLMNNAVNITQLDKYYAEQHTKLTPIWTSWRDISLLLIIFIHFCAIVRLLVMRLHPLDILTSVLLRRYQNKQQQQLTREPTTNENVTMSRPKHKEMPASMIRPMPISNIEREYMRYERDYK